MTNSQIIANISKKLIACIEFQMSDDGMGLSYAEAKAFAAKSSIAGAAVWAVVDSYFANNHKV